MGQLFGDDFPADKLGLMHRDVERFNEWAPTYDRHHLQRRIFEPVQKAVLDLAAEQLARPAAILDIGCGTGRLLRAAEERFPSARLYGVDAAREMVRQARSALAPSSRMQLLHATAEQLPFTDAQFDLVFSTMTFHHWADQRTGIAEIARVLTPVGRWVLADFIARGPMRWVFRIVRPKRFHERDQLDSLLAPARLGVVAERGVPGVWGQITALALANTG